MPTVASLLNDLALLIPDDRAASWDPHGLQVGDPQAPIDTVGVCHEVTDRVVGSAIEAGVQLLISYHPLLFHPDNRWLAGPGPRGRAFRLLTHRMAVAIVHTAWDLCPGGTGDALADAIGLGEVTGFGPADAAPQTKLVTFVPEQAVDLVAAALTGVGAGRIGRYSGCSFRTSGLGTFFPEEGARPAAGRPGQLNREPEVRLEVVVGKRIEGPAIAALRGAHPYEEPAFDLYEVRSNLGMIGRVGNLSEPQPHIELAARVERALDVSSRVAGNRDQVIRRVAVLPGSGASFVGEAAAAGADAYVTGDLSHHQMQEALDRGLAVVDPGHAATERPGVAALLETVRKVHHEVIDLTFDPTPWKDRPDE
ncbi:MAG: Nif3-like dinuclear metal center hexameric protein [Actinomycetota bacterium]